MIVMINLYGLTMYSVEIEMLGSSWNNIDDCMENDLIYIVLSIIINASFVSFSHSIKNGEYL